MIIFEGNRGRVIRMDDAAAQATVGFVRVQDAPITFEQQRSIITRVTVNQQVNAQFLHTLGAHVYIYVFGDRIGQMGLSGLSFNNSCEFPGSMGVEEIMQWYKDNRVSQRAAPVRVMIGRTAIEGFVMSATEDIIDPETGLVQWGVNLTTLPEL